MMKNRLEETTAVPTDDLIQHAMFLAHEVGDWRVPSPEDLADEDALYDGVRASNVKDVEVHDDGVLLIGAFDVAVVTDYIRGSWHHPPEVKTRREEAFFSVMFEWDDGGYATVEVEF